MLALTIPLLFHIVRASSDYYFSNWCGKHLVYLDDRDCQKVFPSSFDRENWSCPLEVLDAPPAGYIPDSDFPDLVVDVTTLADIVTNDVNVCLVLTKRVRDSSAEFGVRLYNKYFCAGNTSAYVGHETWSSSKIFAMANAAGRLRGGEESICSEGSFGLDSTTTGKHGVTPLGDLATIVCSYDSTAGYSSNSLSSYFNDLGWREREDSLVEDWLSAGGAQSLGGNYGEATPSDLGFTLTSSAGNEECVADKDPWPTVYSNTISSLSAAEMTRRIALYREVLPEYRFPGTKWEDMKSELYGAAESVLFPGLQWGGMTSDTAIFLQSSLNISDVELRAQGQWRIFSKLGAGYSSSRQVGEILNNAYACLPRYIYLAQSCLNSCSLDASGSPVPGEGFEFTLSVRGSVPYDTSLVKVEQAVLEAVQQVTAALLDGRLA